MKAKIPILMLAFALSMGAVAKPPENVTSEYLTTENGGFLLRPSRQVSYFVTLAVSEKLQLPAWLQVEFQGRVESADMDLQYVKVEPGQRTLRLESRAFSHADLRKTFRVVVDVFADEKMRKKIGEHAQVIEFRR